MIFKTGGKDNIKPVKTFLYEFYFNFINKRDTLSPFNNRENIKPLFIRDADDENFINVTKNMQNTFINRFVLLMLFYWCFLVLLFQVLVY